MSVRIHLAMLASIAAAHGAGAIDRPATIDVPRVDGEFRIDGALDEAVWARAARTTLDFEIRPGENTPAPIRTEVLLVEDGSALLVAFIAEDPDPSQIRAYLRDRDSAYDDDWVGIVLDTFDDERRAFEFFSNPFGAQMDLINDEVNGNEDDSWDAIWESAGQLTETGYIVEMRIPFRALRFPASGAELTWGMDLIRRYPREHRFQFTAAPRDRDISCYLCQVGRIRGMRGAEPGRNIEITPVLTAAQTWSTPDPLTQPVASQGTDFEPGVDVRWGITPDISLSATINPDFSQIEADSAQLDVNNQFALFFPEKRPFFLEGQDTFSSPFDLIYTRNIADPDLGAKLTGKSGVHTYGMFVTDDTVTNLLIPGVLGSELTSLAQTSTDMAARYRMDVGDSNSTVGAIMTARESDEYYNYVFGVDTNLRFSDTDELTAQIVGSRTRYPDATALSYGQPLGGFSDSLMYVHYNHSERNWWFNASHRAVGEGFRADLGFVSRVGYQKPEIGGGYRWYPEEEGHTWWTEIRWNANVDITHDENGQLLEREVESYFWVAGSLQSGMELGYLDRETYFAGQLFDEHWVGVYGEFTPRGGLSMGTYMRAGQQVDFANAQLADVVIFEPWISWNIGQHFQFRLNHATNRFETLAGAQIFTARVNDLRLTYQFDIRQRLRLIVQHFDIVRNPAAYTGPVDARVRDVAVQLLYSYKVNPQTVFFLGFSEAGFQDDSLPGIETFDRAAFVKISYAYIP